MQRPDVITFDCYGTLIDWEQGIVSAFEERAGRRVDREALLDAYHQAEVEEEMESYRPYREVLAATASRIGSTLGIDTGDGAFLAGSVPSWKPFPDTNPALKRLASAGIRLGILSNIDDDLIAATRRHFDVEFDPVITAQQVGSYKPAHGHFLTARERLKGLSWLHAAQSWYHDIVPAKTLGIAAAWINRKREARTEHVLPDLEFADLAAFADRFEK